VLQRVYILISLNARYCTRSIQTTTFLFSSLSWKLWINCSLLG